MTSVILPSIRMDAIGPAVKALLKDAPSDLEIIVVAPFTNRFVGEAKVRWVLETRREGPIYAINQGHKAAKGDYYFSTNDEAIITGKEIGIMEEQFRDRLVIGSPTQVPPNTKDAYYGKTIAEFPFVSKKVLNIICNNEYFYDPMYGAFWGDPDLSLKALIKNIPVEFCEEAKLFHTQNEKGFGHLENVAWYGKRDWEIFTRRWEYLK